NNIVRDNVAADSRFGYTVYNFGVGTVRVPAFPGADVSVAGQYQSVNMYATPLREFARNEAYCTFTGATFWYLGTDGTTVFSGTPQTVVKDLRVWHAGLLGVYVYPVYNLVFDGLTIRGDINTMWNQYNKVTGLFFSDYMAKGVVVQNADIQGVRVGIEAPAIADVRGASGTDAGLFVVKNSYLRNFVNIVASTMWSVAGPSGLPPRRSSSRTSSSPRSPCPT